MKIALITGGSNGIGKSSAIEVAKRGTKVVITYNSGKDRALEVVKDIEKTGGEAIALKLDVSNVDSFKGFFGELENALKSKWGTHKFNYLFNNAGVGGFNLIENVSEQEFDLMMNVHLKGPFFLTQTLLPLIEDGGHILNMSSATARVAFPGCAPYASMKGAINVFTRYLAKELGDRKIRANSIAPGAIRTNLGGGLDGAPEFVKILTDMTSLGRIGEALDVGRFVASLLSDDTGWVNGQCIEISGGMTL